MVNWGKASEEMERIWDVNSVGVGGQFKLRVLGLY
jgi:hypothetical protein